MMIDQVFVTVGGLILVGSIAWFFWFSKKEAVRVSTGESGTQEVFVTVKGGYTPDLIVVQAGKPLRINFQRQETAVCSEQVLFPDFNKQATLTPYKTVAVEFTPEKPGTFGFQCGMGMLRGKLVVE